MSISFGKLFNLYLVSCKGVGRVEGIFTEKTQKSKLSATVDGEVERSN